MWITGDSLSAPPMPPRCERFTNRLAWIWRLTGERSIIYDGDIHIPVLTLHTTGDGLVVVENESAYKQVVWEDGNGEFLRRTRRVPHCTFTPAETIAAVQTLLARLETGRWPEVDASTLNTAALSTGPAFMVLSMACRVNL